MSSELNPFEPTIFSAEVAQQKQSVAPVEIRFVYDYAFLREATRRVRGQLLIYKLLLAADLLWVLGFTGYAYYQFTIRSPDVLFTLMMSGFLPGVRAVIRTLSWLRTNSQIKKSPSFNSSFVIKVSDSGLQTTSSLSNLSLKWDYFAYAVIYDDGVLIMHNRNAGNWLSEQAIQPPSTLDNLRSLIESNMRKIVYKTSTRR